MCQTHSHARVFNTGSFFFLGTLPPSTQLALFLTSFVHLFTFYLIVSLSLATLFNTGPLSPCVLILSIFLLSIYCSLKSYALSVYWDLPYQKEASAQEGGCVHMYS